MDTIRINDEGAAVEDIQRRLMRLGLLETGELSGTYDEATAQAVAEFCKGRGLPVGEEVTQAVWNMLVDESYELGDRTLYLRMPYFHGHDVLELQEVLGALGFSSGFEDGIFGPSTEMALRKFQMNMGIPSDGIAGAYTYEALYNLHHSWEDKGSWRSPVSMGFARAADVLEANSVCIFGTSDFARNVASRMSNLAQATNPSSKILSADTLSVAPNENTLLLRVVLAGDELEPSIPAVDTSDLQTLPRRLESAIGAARKLKPPRLALVLPSETWEDAGVNRSAQHFAITLLDGLCTALS